MNKTIFKMDIVFSLNFEILKFNLENNLISIVFI